MKAFVIDRYKAPVELRDIAPPAMGPTDLLVEVRAASVNPVDLKIRDGGIKVLVKDKFPLTLGSDLSGVVMKVGAQVTRFAPGDEVFARLEKDRIGAFAEQAVVAEFAAAKKPASLSHVQAASIPLVALTAWQAFVDSAQLKAGEKVLIHAGSGGLGTIAIQLARHLGAVVTTTVSGKNAQLVKRLGADHVIDYKTQKFDALVNGQDLVLDTQGGETLLRSFKTLKAGGLLITVNGVPDAKFGKAYGMNPLLVLGLRFLARKETAMAERTGTRFEFIFMKPEGTQLARISELLEQGALVPVLDRTFPFAQTREALAYVECGRSVGKVVIEMTA